MRRRAVLAIGAALLTGGLAGCSAAIDPRTTPDPWADADPSYPDDRTVPPDASMHHLYVENFDEESYPVTLTVVRPDDEVLVWRAAYEAPDGRGFEIRDLLVDGRTYEIALAIDEGERSTTELTIDPCQIGVPATGTEDEPTPRSEGGGSRNVGVWIEHGAVSFHQDICDEIRVGRLPIGNHDYFMVQE